MDRNSNIKNLENKPIFDVVIIGGGATGLGAAVDASHRGLRVALFEKYDFAKGTSSKSTKLLHGGVRYLAQGNFRLVFDALRERGIAIKNAPHLTHTVPFVIPVYRSIQKLYYFLGLKLYDLLSGNKNIGKTHSLDKAQTLCFLPSINPDRLYGGVMYNDGAFDDARLAISLAQTASSMGCTIVNYSDVLNIEVSQLDYKTVDVFDKINHQAFSIRAKVIINATGIFAEEMVKGLPNTMNKIKIAPAQGIHLVVDQKYFIGHHALLIPRTSDGRVLFAVPWHQKVIIGTTDTPLKKLDIEPQAKEKEIKFIIHTFNKYAKTKLTRDDICSVYAGIRPLVKHHDIKNTAKISRDHTIADHKNGVITITGGKWTTYRKMGEEVIQKAIKNYGLVANNNNTKELRIYGYTIDAPIDDRLGVYGTDASIIIKLEKDFPSYKELIHPNYPYTRSQLVYAMLYEMVVKPEDFLARRIRLLLLDAKACSDCILQVTLWMKEINGKSDDWVKTEVADFNTLVSLYLPS